MRNAAQIIAAAIAAVTLALGAARAEDTPAGGVPIEQLSEKLEQATEARLDIDLKSGKSYVRCKLIQITRGKEGMPPRTLKFQDADSPKPTTVSFTAIRSITLDRQLIYEAPSSGKKVGKEAEPSSSATPRPPRREPREMGGQRPADTNVKPWPELTTAQHRAAEQATRDQIVKMQAIFPDLALYETHEFLFVSDMPRDQVIPYAVSLDQMYDMMCQMYGIKKGSSVWMGKCPIVAFLRSADFARFEMEFYNLSPGETTQGLCHSSNASGDVLISCYCGDSSRVFWASPRSRNEPRLYSPLSDWRGAAPFLGQRRDGRMDRPIARRLRRRRQTHPRTQGWPPSSRAAACKCRPGVPSSSDLADPLRHGDPRHRFSDQQRQAQVRRMGQRHEGREDLARKPSKTPTTSPPNSL